MARWNISGVWVGEYSYHFNIETDVPLRACPFTLTAVRGWFGHFRGSVQDDPVLGCPGAAIITGDISGVMVFFQKVYPEFYCQEDDDDRTFTIRQYLARREIPLDHKVPAQPIRYTGRYDAEQETIRGSWVRDEVVFSSGVGAN